MAPRAMFVSGFAGTALVPAGERSARSARRPQRTARRASRGVRMCDGGAAGGPTNFDDLAKKLADELQGMGATPGPVPSGAGVDAPMTGEAPFEISEGNGGIPKIVLHHRASGQSADLYTYGACVTSWKTRGVEHLWLSDLNQWELGGKPIRGGIPLCFPQFGPYGDLEQHGFARIADWALHDTVLDADGSATAVLTLDNGADGGCAEMAKWPFQFAAEYSVTLSATGLETKLAVTNTGDSPMPFTFAFHNYFAASSAGDTRIYGTEGVRYYDRLDGDRECPPMKEDGAGLMLTEETDRVYLNMPSELAVFDFASLKVLKIKKTDSLPNTTVWNPFGKDGCDPGWEKFICLEPAVVTPPALVQPGETWVGAQLLGVE